MEEMDREEPSSWLEWFLLCKSTLKINTNAKKALFEAFDASISKECIKVEFLEKKCINV